MRVRNKTRYRTRELTELTRRAAREVPGAELPYLLDVLPADRPGGLWGWAYIGSRRSVTVVVPTPFQWASATWPRTLPEFVAAVLEHELWHTVGAEHGDMPPDVRQGLQPVGWAAGVELVWRQPRITLASVAKTRAAQRQIEADALFARQMRAACYDAMGAR